MISVAKEFNPLRSCPKAASRPSRQKQIPAAKARLGRQRSTALPICVSVTPWVASYSASSPFASWPTNLVPPPRRASPASPTARSSRSAGCGPQNTCASTVPAHPPLPALRPQGRGRSSLPSRHTGRRHSNRSTASVTKNFTDQTEPMSYPRYHPGKKRDRPEAVFFILSSSQKMATRRGFEPLLPP